MAHRGLEKQVKAVVLVIALTLPALPLQAQEIGIGLSCQYWGDLTDKYEIDDRQAELIKTLFVRGIYEGAATSTYGASLIAKQFAAPHSEEDAKKAVLASLPNTFYTNTSYKVLVDALNTFCEDAHHKKIRITDALQIISMEIKGDSAESIEARTNLAKQLGSDEL